jgi:hypothetical protein
MAFRIDKAVVRGELCNEQRGAVTGRIWLAGRKEPVLLNLRGDCLRDLAGGTVRFTNPRPAPDPALAVLAPEQNGVAGELTGSRKVRQPTVSDLEVLELMEKDQPIPCRIANCLYLEWYSEENGRVVIESTDYTVGVTVPVWTMTAEENAEQLAASQQHFHRFIHAITGDDEEEDGDGEDLVGLEPGDVEDLLAGGAGDERDEGGLDVGSGLPGALADLDAAAREEAEAEFIEGVPLDEFEWEQELRDADRRAEAYQEAFEKYRDHPEREKMIAAALGWDDEGDADDEPGSGSPLGSRLLDEALAGLESGEEAASWPPGDDEPAELGDEDPFGSHHPLSQRAMDFALALQREAEERGLMGDTPEARDHSPVLSLILHIITLGGKLAGALDGWAQGLDPEPGFIIAMLKRAQVPLNEALHAFDCIDASSLTAETRQWLQTRKRDLFELRREIVDLMHQLRTS